MHNQPLSRRRLTDIRQAIERAKAYAVQQGVPLTVERLAAELDMDLPLFHRVVEGLELDGGRSAALKTAAIQRASSEATASVMEHAMQRGSSPNMHMLYLKNNAGYDLDKSGKGQKPAADAGGSPPVVFVGEERIKD